MSYTPEQLVAKLNEMSVWMHFKDNLEQPARREISGGAKLIVSGALRRKAYMAAMEPGGDLESIGELYTSLVAIPLPGLTDGNGNPLTMDAAADELEALFLVWLNRATEIQEAAALLDYEFFKGGLPNLPESEEGE